MAFLLNSLENINSALAAVKNNPSVRPEKFYSKILLDTIKTPVEDYVHVKHATTSYTIPQGHQKLELRRFGSWTEHLEVLKEGIPPRPDVTRSEKIELSYMQFGRFAFFTDQIRTDVLDDFVAHYTKELSDLANRTIEKFAREKLLSSTNRYYANGKTSMSELVPGDIITIADLRLIALKLDRAYVGKIGNFFNYICSPEFMYDLIDDEYVQSYMELNQNTFNLYTNGEPFPLFKVRYIETKLDENMAPDLDHPGEYLDADGNYWIRMSKKDGSVVYSIKDEHVSTGVVNNESDVSDETKLGGRYILKEYYYKDGSAIENRIYWKINSSVSATGSNTEGIYVLDANGNYVEGDQNDVTQAILEDSVELPVNRGILTGAKGLAKLNVEGQGSAQIIIKPLGSGGTNDPLNQLSSIGFKIQGLGFGFERMEAVYITLSVPNHALDTVGISRDAILGQVGSHVHEEGNIVENASGDDEYAVSAWQASKAYSLGERVSNSGSYYIATVSHTSHSSTFATDLTAGKWVKYGEVEVDNPGDLGLETKVSKQAETSVSQVPTAIQTLTDGLEISLSISGNNITHTAEYPSTISDLTGYKQDAIIRFSSPLPAGTVVDAVTYDQGSGASPLNATNVSLAGKTEIFMSKLVEETMRNEIEGHAGLTTTMVFTIDDNATNISAIMSVEQIISNNDFISWYTIASDSLEIEVDA